MSDYIPEGIMVQLLKRLPVETLLRFRCVCKGWRQLIDSPSLVLDHLALQKPRLIGVDHPGGDAVEISILVVDPQTLPMLYTTLRSPIEIRVYNTLTGTHHGIVCLYQSYTMRDGIFLYNPWIRKFLIVPLPQDMECHRDEAPETDTIPSTYSAFWINPFTKHFKIIVIKMVYTYRERWEKYGAIYSSIEDNWEELVCLGEIENYAFLEVDPAVVMGNVAYWRVFHGIDINQVDFHRAAVISFDFEQQRFEVIDGPSVSYRLLVFGQPSLLNWQGILSLVYLDQDNTCDIYTRQQGSWVNLFRFDLIPNITRVLCILEERGRVLGKEMQENCKVLAITNDDYELLTYDTRDACCVNVRTGDDEVLYGGFMAYDFVESLLFP